MSRWTASPFGISESTSKTLEESLSPEKITPAQTEVPIPTIPNSPVPHTQWWTEARIWFFVLVIIALLFVIMGQFFIAVIFLILALLPVAPFAAALLFVFAIWVLYETNRCGRCLYTGYHCL